MRRTDEMTVTLAKPGTKPRVFMVSNAVARKVETLMKQAGSPGKTIPATHVLPELADDVLRPASVLRGARYREQMTQVNLAARVAVRQSHLSEMENGKRPIGKSMAKKLATIFDCDYRLFL